MLKSTVTE